MMLPPVLGYILYRLFSHITITFKNYGFVIYLFYMYININQLSLPTSFSFSVRGLCEKEVSRAGTVLALFYDELRLVGTC